ncbi:MAG TPA: glycoside hydrolase family 3 C-terminal domain-containing protein [Bryobacteraceae bacterium]|nr:glycoside hydrolase family 3 C-terminal domain-containing protein [Bryobacteraceae bacterium]
MPRKLRFAACVLLGSATLLAAGQFPYQNPGLPMERRVDDLLSRLTLAEKVSQLMNDSPAIDRLGIPAYNWWNESLHGVARAGRATVFPEAIGLAATWDTDLMLRVSTAISDEARAKHHEFVRRGKRNIYQGLTFWTPNINLFRDPRWGRGMETYGEDPYLTGRMAVAFIQGMQGDDPRYLKTIATAKHYAVHSGPEPLRHSFDAVPAVSDLVETYLPHFEAAVREGGAWSVMCSYNRVNGLPACANPQLLEDILRKQWGFQGYVVSDCGAIGDIYLNHKAAPDAERGIALALRAGTDLNCGVEYANLIPAVQHGVVSEAEIDRALRRLLLARFKLGMFDPAERVKWARIPYSENDSPAHRQLALETARKSIVLLKNEGHVLPLSKSLKTIAVIGPNADSVDALLGNYNGIPSEPVTILEGIRKKLPQTRVLYARGGELAANMPTFEVIPATALSASGSLPRTPGLNAGYYASSNFDGRAHRPRELTYPSSGQMVGTIPAHPQPLFTRVDPQIDFNWWDGAPRPDMNDDDFGVRWSGYLTAPVSGTYHLGASCFNAFELYVDDKLLAEANDIHERRYEYGSVPLEAGRSYAIRLDYHQYVGDAACQLVWARPASVDTHEATEAAAQADAIVLVLGLSPRLEGEEMRVPVEGFQGGDRISLDLPRAQEELLQNIAAGGKPVVLVLLNGSAVAVTWARAHVPAIVEAWYPGQAGGAAVADVLFGDYNPAGRLPVTFYQSEKQLPPFTDYGMQGRTYRYFTGKPLFAFGYGLSYTTFAYRSLSVPKRIAAGEPIAVSVEVENTGTIAGEEVVELYVHKPQAESIRSLQGFARVFLEPEERKVVRFTLQSAQVSGPGSDGQSRIDLAISAGGSQSGSGVLTTTVQISPLAQ